MDNPVASPTMPAPTMAISQVSVFIGFFPGALSYKKSLGQIAPHYYGNHLNDLALKSSASMGACCRRLPRLRNGPMTDEVGTGKMNSVSVREHKAIHFPEVFKNFL